MFFFGILAMILSTVFDMVISFLNCLANRQTAGLTFWWIAYEIVSGLSLTYSQRTIELLAILNLQQKPRARPHHPYRTLVLSYWHGATVLFDFVVFGSVQFKRPAQIPVCKSPRPSLIKRELIQTSPSLPWWKGRRFLILWLKGFSSYLF